MASFATQVQIRRGTEAENNAFTGAEGEVTMDLTNKQLRVHDGQTKGGMKIPNIETVFGTNQIVNGSITPEKMVGQPTFTGNAGKTLAVNQAGNGFEFIESTLPENSDYVIESQEPTEANGYTWYRLYKSGWVEQGGEITAASVADGTGSSGNNSIILPVIMANEHYHINLQTQVGSSGWDYANGVILNLRSTTKLIVKVLAGTGSIPLFWQVSGMSAQGSN